jgi:hypothetical protein
MTTEAQTIANQQNAQKSTGPRTPEGKAASSQNAVKHGLFARYDVICAESQEQFDSHRDSILAELAPAGPIQSIFAERIVSLSWRLKRAERMQNQAFDAKIERYSYSFWEKLISKDQEKSQSNPSDLPPDLILGRVVTSDFANYKVLDCLQLYERRIEQSLYKAMREFQKLTLTPKPKRPTDPRSVAETPDSDRGRIKNCHSCAPASSSNSKLNAKDSTLIMPQLKKQTQFAKGQGSHKSLCHKDLW